MCYFIVALISRMFAVEIAAFAFDEDAAVFSELEKILSQE